MDALDYYCLDDNNNDEIGDDDDYSDDDGYSEDESLEDINRKDGDEDGMKDKIEKENNGENNENQKHLDGASISNTSIFTSSSIDKIKNKTNPNPNNQTIKNNSSKNKGMKRKKHHTNNRSSTNNNKLSKRALLKRHKKRRDAYQSLHLDDNDTNYHRSNWTQAETDLLLQLAKTYGLRWPIIADRWRLITAAGNNNYKSHISNNGQYIKQVEDLQYRYYTIGAAINRRRLERAVREEAEVILSKNSSSVNSVVEGIGSASEGINRNGDNSTVGGGGCGGGGRKVTIGAIENNTNGGGSIIDAAKSIISATVGTTTTVATSGGIGQDK